MNKPIIDKTFGREAFGLDRGSYDTARPAYPEWVYDVLAEHCGLRPGAAAFEIGPGTGIATRRLLELGANPLVAIEPDHRLAETATLLKPGGWWVMFWNVFGDPGRADPFHEATKTLLNGPIGPSREHEVPFALDKDARMAALEETNAFDSLEYQSNAWSLVLDANETVRLYATYSNINIRPDRTTVLEELGRIARDEFQGRVVRNMITSLYIARRRPISQ